MDYLCTKFDYEIKKYSTIISSEEIAKIAAHNLTLVRLIQMFFALDTINVIKTHTKIACVNTRVVQPHTIRSTAVFCSYFASSDNDNFMMRHMNVIMHLVGCLNRLQNK